MVKISAVSVVIFLGLTKRTLVIWFLLILVVFCHCDLYGFQNTEKTILRVGPTFPYNTPSAAAAVAGDGDVVQILAGTYRGDVAVWQQNNLTLRGVHGKARIEANGKNADGKGIWVIKGNNTVIENLELSGASVPDHNGAGIRLEGSNLTVRNCYFHDNENGILTGENLKSDIVIDRCEFANNGFGNGYTHNLYIGAVNSLTVKFSYTHHAKVGHNLKSRARTNYILYNRIMDEKTGNSSYAVDISNGGICYLIGNIIQQGPNTDNYHIISYGNEGLSYSTNELFVVNNTIVNDRNDGVFIKVHPKTSKIKLINNIFYGKGTVISKVAELQTNLIINRKKLLGFNISKPIFVDIANFDYRLNPASLAIDAGSNPGTAEGFSLTPMAQYHHPTSGQKRIVFKKIDIGAYEFVPDK